MMTRRGFLRGLLSAPAATLGAPLLLDAPAETYLGGIGTVGSAGVVDIFDTDAFRFASMIDAIERVPYIPERVTALGLFSSGPLETDRAVVDEDLDDEGDLGA